MNRGLDHVGVVSRDLTALAAQYERLGFTLTPLARHADGRIGNRCVMLPGCYVELLAVVDPNARSATLERFLARYAGIHILAFAIADEQAELARLRRAGIDDASLSRFERAVNDADPTGPLARLVLIHTPDQPEGRINLVRHETPELLWQERFLHHANNVVALDELVIAVANPAETAARISRLVGCVVVPDRREGFVLDLPGPRVRMVTAVDGPPCAPCVTATTMRTSDGNAAVSRLLADRNLAHTREAGTLLVDASLAGGVVCRFVAGQ